MSPSFDQYPVIHTAWWQRHMGVNNLLKVIMQLCPEGNWTHNLPYLSQVQHLTAMTPCHPVAVSLVECWWQLLTVNCRCGQVVGVRLYKVPLALDLQSLCRLVIRQYYDCQDVEHLPLPTTLKAYLRFQPSYGWYHSSTVHELTFASSQAMVDTTPVMCMVCRTCGTDLFSF